MTPKITQFWVFISHQTVVNCAKLFHLLNLLTMYYSAEELDNATLEDREFYDLYCEYLNDIFGIVQIGSLTFDPSKIIEELDPIAFRVGFSDFLDTLY